jgi:hypothetical protein
LEAEAGGGGFPEWGTGETRAASGGCKSGRRGSAEECRPDTTRGGGSGREDPEPRRNAGSGGASPADGRVCAPIFLTDADSAGAEGFPGSPATRGCSGPRATTGSNESQSGAAVAAAVAGRSRPVAGLRGSAPGWRVPGREGGSVGGRVHRRPPMPLSSLLSNYSRGYKPVLFGLRRR